MWWGRFFGIYMPMKICVYTYKFVPLEYMPVMSRWIWEDLRKTILVHLKIVDPSNTWYDEEEQYQLMRQKNWTHYFKYSNTQTEDFKQTCSGMFKKKAINEVAM